MPQMAPMWWSTLFLVMIAAYMLTVTMTYFYNIYSPMIKKMLKFKIAKNPNWKW